MRNRLLNLSPSVTARAFVALVIAAGIVVATAMGVPLRDPRLWFWIVACGIGEMLWLRLPLGRATLSMGSTSNFAALLVLPVQVAVPAATLASICVELAIMRKPAVRALFNAAGTALAVAAAGSMLHALAPHGPFVLRDAGLFGVLAAAAVTYYAVNRGLVSTVLALDGALPVTLVWRRNFGWRRDVFASGAAMSLGVLVADLHQQTGPVAILFVLLPTMIVFEAHRRLYAMNSTRPAPAELVDEPTRKAVNE